MTTFTKVDYAVALEIACHEAIVCGRSDIGKPQSLDLSLRVYVWALDNYADAVRKTFKGVSLTKSQFAAALSFHWNTGAIAKAYWVTKFKAGDISGARKAFMLYNKPKEIVGRRQKERDLFFDGVWSNDGTIIEYTTLSSQAARSTGAVPSASMSRKS